MSAARAAAQKLDEIKALTEGALFRIKTVV
jgi:hypothetical protein